jgi:pyruvate formate lyase activating enzyme
LILSNLKQLDDEGAKIQLRCPMIPGHNARREHLDGIVALAKSMPRIESVELLPYYDLWRAKLDRFGLKTQLPESVKPPDRQTVDSWKDYLRLRGVPVV